MIVVRGARTHNLKNLNLEIPKNKLVVITGLSGSGKSSLAFDTLYAEGQRRYVESLSAYARQFLQLMEKPDVDSIDGLSPAISIEQKTTSKNPRSTVGTVTEIYDYLRLLFARIGVPHSPATGLPIEAQTVSQMVDKIAGLNPGTRFLILAPIVRGRKGEYQKELKDLIKKGFVRFKIDGSFYEADDLPTLNKKLKHDVAIVVDRLVIPQEQDVEWQRRVAGSLETALGLTEGLIFIEDYKTQETLLTLSSKFACPVSGFTLKDIEPRLFSFNSPQGACPDCNGLGVEHSLGFFSAMGFQVGDMEDFTGETPCPTCKGSRLNDEALCVKINTLTIADITQKSLEECALWFDTLALSTQQAEIGERILKEIKVRLKFLLDVGLEYLTLARTAGTLSGGESQRIRLASQIGSGLTGVLYVLDEPSIGLHQRDNDRLLDTLKHLKSLGNTVIVVEHDEDAIRFADHVIDMGPGAGTHGGHIVVEGTPQEVMDAPQSVTGQYLKGEKVIPFSSQRRPGHEGKFIELKGARLNNLKDVSVQFPLGTFTCVTGVSGGGKSSLVIGTLYKALQTIPHYVLGKGIQKTKHSFKECESLEGLEHIDKVIDIDQSPIGRTPRSNPATYIGCFTPIREWFAALPEAKARGYTPGRFSFNVRGGRCEACEGDGVLKIEMHFLPDVYVTCETCQGKRYNRETLDIQYKGKTIADVLAMTVEDACDFFSAIPSVSKKMHSLLQVGLGYIQVGQQATTLSGGEAQRIKLAKELSRRSTGKTFYILDEPTTGLHFEDIRKLLEVLHTLVDQGNTVLVIEHNLDVIKTADWIIDMGPEGGAKGGQVVCVGTPEEVSQCPQSYTGKYLKKSLGL